MYAVDCIKLHKSHRLFTFRSNESFHMQNDKHLRIFDCLITFYPKKKKKQQQIDKERDKEGKNRKNKSFMDRKKTHFNKTGKNKIKIHTQRMEAKGVCK